MPSRIVRMIPPGCLPGMMNLASAPAISPNRIHIRMPMVRSPSTRFLGPFLSFYEAGPTAPLLPIVWAERVALGAELSVARLLSLGGPFSSYLLHGGRMPAELRGEEPGQRQRQNHVAKHLRQESEPPFDMGDE